jgi:hypothetical protein
MMLSDMPMNRYYDVGGQIITDPLRKVEVTRYI